MYSECIKRKLEIIKNASRHLACRIRLINTAYYQTENDPMCKERIINMDIFVTCAGYFSLSLNKCVYVCVYTLDMYTCMWNSEDGAEISWS